MPAGGGIPRIWYKPQMPPVLPAPCCRFLPWPQAYSSWSRLGSWARTERHL